MIEFWVLVALGHLIGFSLYFLARHLRNPRQRHQGTPAKFNIPFEEVRFPTCNNRELYGWWIPVPESPTNPAPTLILVHGWGRNVERMMMFIRYFHPKGYNLLAFDARHHGSSDRDGYASMVKFAEDLQAAIDFVGQQTNTVKGSITIIGLSIGGSAAIFAASQDSRIKNIVTVGAFAHPETVMKLRFGSSRVMVAPLSWLLFKYFEFRIGKTMDEIAPVNNIHKTAANVYLIHGTDDEVVPVSEGQKLAAAGNPDKVRLWTIPGKGHSNCHKHPDFWNNLDSFFEGMINQ